MILRKGHDAVRQITETLPKWCQPSYLSNLKTPQTFPDPNADRVTKEDKNE